MLSIPPYQVTKAAPRVRNGRSDFAGGYFLPASPALPDWGLEPAASSWIRLGLTTDARQEHHLHLHPRQEREPKKSRNNVESESPEVTTIMIWNVPHSVYCEELRSIFEGVNGIVAVYYSSLRRLMLVDFVTRQAARKAHNLLRDNWARNNWLRNYKLNTAFFRNKKYVFDRYSSLPWARSGTSVCIQGLDSSLHVDEIRTMLAGHFGPNNEGIRIPTKLDGSSIGNFLTKLQSVPIDVNYTHAGKLT